jgi:hypothetical protein
MPCLLVQQGISRQAYERQPYYFHKLAHEMKKPLNRWAIFMLSLRDRPVDHSGPRD